MIIKFAGRDFQLPDHPDILGLFDNEKEIRENYWLIKPGDVVFDVGCYYGTYAIPALIAGADVYAIDPYPQYTSMLCHICQMNNVDTSKLVTVHEAVSGPGGYSGDYWKAASAVPGQEIHAQPEHTFTTLDDLATRRGITRLDWVKIDVEGAELGVLQGSVESLRKFRPVLLIEDHSSIYQFVADMESPKRCFELLHGLGYTIKTVPYQDQRLHQGERASFLDRDFWICYPEKR